MPVTRTLNPLPFTDLEPKRFEDLVRQLIYDFRPWNRLEATGRAGSDDGYDARGIERLSPSDAEPDSDEERDEDETNIAPSVDERVWLIQCKRERAIGPTKLEKYLEEITQEERKKLYGLIFVACCDFSKRSRDVLANWCRTNGLSEFQIWSVSDIETMLLQPKNDHILFAFFGISLQIRKRAVATAVRSIVTTKKRIHRLLERQRYARFLIRDIEDTKFPFVDKGAKPHWLVRQQAEFDFRGIGFTFKDYFAYADGNQNWDIANAYNLAVSEESNPWAEEEDGYADQALRGQIRQFNVNMPGQDRAKFKIEAFIPFSEILVVDEIGDPVFGEDAGRPTLYVRFKDGRPVTHPHINVELIPAAIDRFQPDKKKRIKYFPENFRVELK
jgi:hypothetical protein